MFSPSSTFVIIFFSNLFWSSLSSSKYPRCCSSSQQILLCLETIISSYECVCFVLCKLWKSFSFGLASVSSRNLLCVSVFQFPNKNSELFCFIYLKFPPKNLDTHTRHTQNQWPSIWRKFWGRVKILVSGENSGFRWKFWVQAKNFGSDEDLSLGWKFWF